MGKHKTVINIEEYKSMANRNLKLAIVVSLFNSHITDLLLKGSLDFLKGAGFRDEDISVYKVPGAFEIPAVCDRIISKNKVNGIITLGAVIKGDTNHYDYVCSESARGIMDLSMKYKTPVSYGILTCNNEKQALDRAGGKCGNKGIDSAKAVLDLIRLNEQI